MRLKRPGPRALAWLVLALGLGAAVVAVVTVGVRTGRAEAAQPTACQHPDPRARSVVPLASGELRALAALAWGEARNGGYCSMQAVAAVVINRIRKRPDYFGATVTQVLNKPYAFSVFGRQDPNRRKVAKVDESDPEFIAAMLAAISAVGGADPVGGADHFFSGSRPGWARTMTVTATLGGHTFMRSP